MAITFPTTLDSFTDKTDNVDDVMAVDINDVQDAVEALETKMGIDSSGVAASLDYKVNNFFAAGRKVWLYENTAPTGWTIAGVSDITLAVKGGAGLYNVAGGNVAGESWANLKAHYHSGPSHTHGVGSLAGPSHAHNLTLPEIGWTGGTEGSGGRTQSGSGIYRTSERIIASAAGGTGAVTGSMAADGTGNTGAQSTADVRPTAAVGIIITKN